MRSSQRIAVVPGDGIGVEVTRQAVRVLERVAEQASLDLELVPWDLGADRFLRTGVAITDAEMADLESNYSAILLGALGDPRVPGDEHSRAVLLGLRFRLDLYINLRPIRLYDPALSPLRNATADRLDMVVVRENTEGSYVGIGGHFKRGTSYELAIQEEVNTRFGVERIVRAAFEYARSAGRRRVTLADKANAMPFAGSLWRRVFDEVAAEYPELEREAMYVDAVALEMVLHPERFDVIVTSNMFGDILSDLAAGLIGGMGLAPSANLHPGRPGLFEPVHGSAPDIAGQDRANPLAAILSTALLLDDLGYPREAERIRRAVTRTIQTRRVTPELGGTLGTAAVGEAVCQELDTPE
jgi:3-isopropylmalate dehydrogenase